MSINALDQAITSHPFRPKGIKVGFDLWKNLTNAGRIKWKRGYIEGVIDSKIDFPVLNEEIFVHVAPELENLEFELPQSL